MRTTDRKGFTLIATGVCITSLLGMLGLALDLGRVYITKNETQSFTDTAAIAAGPKPKGGSVFAAQRAFANKTKKQGEMATPHFFPSRGASTIPPAVSKPPAAHPPHTPNSP